MKRFYHKLSKPEKIIFLILTIPLPTIISAFVGFSLGMYAINFIPDQCVTEGISTICQNPFNFLGLIGWEGTTALGLIVGAIVFPVIYLMLLFRSESKNNFNS